MTAVTDIFLAPGDILYREGGENDCGYVVAEGELTMYTERTGQRVDMERRGPGTVLGALSVLTGQPRPVTAEAITHCRIFSVPAEQILDRYAGLDPVLRACVETSINFSNLLQNEPDKDDLAVPQASKTLRDNENLISKFEFECDLMNGIDRKEFFLLYQPIVRLEDGAIEGFEALMRWVHPERGFVSPGEFIPAAEAINEIDKLTDFALMEACAALKRIHQNAGIARSLFASVNISAKDLGRRDFVEFLTHVVDLNDLSPEQIKLEITESALITDTRQAEQNLARLRALDYGISVDDFGTGYSNLAYLKSLPLTTLKIDRAFAGDAHTSPVSRGIVRLLLALGKELDVDIIAEGLETFDDVETLRSLGCHYAQGFYYHKPMPEAELTELLTGAAPKQDAA